MKFSYLGPQKIYLRTIFQGTTTPSSAVVASILTAVLFVLASWLELKVLTEFPLMNFMLFTATLMEAVSLFKI